MLFLFCTLYLYKYYKKFYKSVEVTLPCSTIKPSLTDPCLPALMALSHVEWC